MAILVVRIEDDSTLLMNEFFDYNGMCYGHGPGRRMMRSASTWKIFMRELYRANV